MLKSPRSGPGMLYVILCFVMLCYRKREIIGDSFTTMIIRSYDKSCGSRMPDVMPFVASEIDFQFLKKTV